MSGHLSKFLIVAALALVSCSKQASTDADSTTPGNGGGNGNSGTPLTSADLIGTHWGSCQNITTNAYGADMNGGSFLPGIYFSAAGNYHIDMQFYTAPNCQFGSGGEAWAYTGFGSFGMGGTTVGGRTPITFVTGSTNLTVYTTAPPNGSSSVWAPYFNSYCSTNPGFSTIANDGKSVSGLTCAHAGSSPVFTLPQFPAASSTYYNLISLSNGIITLTLPDTLFVPGLSAGFPSAPGNYTFTF